MPTSPTTWLEINLDAMSHNIAVVRGKLRPETRLVFVVKADAYGHGIAEIATRAATCGIETFAVISLNEGNKIRRTGYTGTILLLGTPEPVGGFCETLLEERLEPTVSSSAEVQFLESFCTNRDVSLPVHLKIDTGLSRLGVRWTEAVSLAKTIAESPRLRLTSIYSHLAGYEDTDIDRQVAHFCQTLDAIRAEGIAVPMVHLVKSATVFRRPDLHLDQVRIGAAIYGVATADGGTAMETLRPVMSLKTKIVLVKTILPGEGISYCPQWFAPTETKVGILGMGYANGIPRALSGKMNAIVSGRLVPQIGLITMNHLMVDLSSVPNAAVGDTATLLGKDGDVQITVNELAEAMNTNPREILCLLGNSNQKRSVIE